MLLERLTKKRKNMSKYDPLYDCLTKCNKSRIILTFNELEEILGFTLPNSAYLYEWWWANEDIRATSHTHCKVWQNAGYKTKEVDLSNKNVVFVKA